MLKFWKCCLKMHWKIYFSSSRAKHRPSCSHTIQDECSHWACHPFHMLLLLLAKMVCPNIFTFLLYYNIYLIWFYRKCKKKIISKKHILPAFMLRSFRKATKNLLEIYLCEIYEYRIQSWLCFLRRNSLWIRNLSPYACRENNMQPGTLLEFANRQLGCIPLVHKWSYKYHFIPLKKYFVHSFHPKVVLVGSYECLAFRGREKWYSWYS